LDRVSATARRLLWRRRVLIALKVAAHTAGAATFSWQTIYSESHSAVANPVEVWKRQKHGLDVWPEVLAHASARSSMKEIPPDELERMKWYGVFYRKRDAPGAYMLRIRITANELSSAQAKEIARVAYELGHGIVDVTTRANIQVQGLKIEDVPRALMRLEAVGLSCRQTGHDNVRNVFGHPLSGVDPDELADTRPICRAITEKFLNNRPLADLPRKFNIAVCGRSRHGIHYWTQDLALLACTRDERIGFHALIGGKQGQQPRLGLQLPVFVPPWDAPALAMAILELFQERGSREKRDAARFRWLIEDIGVEGVLSEIERRLGRRLERSAAEPPRPDGYEELVGWLPQREAERWALGLCPALGRLSWLQLEAVAIIAQRYGNSRLRTTPEQGLIALDIRDAWRQEAAAQLAQVNLCVHPDSRVRNVVACTGKQFCNIAVTETKAHALKLIEQLRQRSLELHGLRIHMSGCPSACGNHHTADIGLKGVRVKRLLGTREGFDVFLGGGVAGRLQLGLLYKLGVDVLQLPQLIEEVVREYYLRHAHAETFSEYWRRSLSRRLAGAATAAAEKDFRAPLWECECCGHHFAGEDPPVFCPQCGGLRRHFARLDQQSPSVGAAANVVQTEDGYVEVAPESAVPEGSGLRACVEGQELALFRVGGEIRALDGICPHAGGSLADGAIEDGAVICPLHHWRFDASSGAAIAPAQASVTVYPVQIDEGKVLVKLSGRGA
jgi:ferredoxin-nitrite reductase